jgi:hypothetical protein
LIETENIPFNQPMQTSIPSLLPNHFSPESRLWIYASPRPFTTDEVQLIETASFDFLSQWKAHGKAVQGFLGIYLNQFIVLAADETEVVVSGCSTDQSVHWVQSIAQQLSIDLFDRTLISFWINEQVVSIRLDKLTEAIRQQIIRPDSLYINTTVLNKNEFEESGIIPANISWLKRYF